MKIFEQKHIEDHDCIFVCVCSFGFLLPQTGVVCIIELVALGNIHREVSKIWLVFLGTFLQLGRLLTAVRQTTFLRSDIVYLWTFWLLSTFWVAVPQLGSRFVVVFGNIDWSFVLLCIKVPKWHAEWLKDLLCWLDWIGLVIRYFYKGIDSFLINTLNWHWETAIYFYLRAFWAIRFQIPLE